MANKLELNNLDYCYCTSEKCKISKECKRNVNNYNELKDNSKLKQIDGVNNFCCGLFDKLYR